MCTATDRPKVTVAAVLAIGGARQYASRESSAIVCNYVQRKTRILECRREEERRYRDQSAQQFINRKAQTWQLQATMEAQSLLDFAVSSFFFFFVCLLMQNERKLCPEGLLSSEL